MPDINLEEADRLLTTTKHVRRRLDLSREVPTELLLECIDFASRAPVAANRELNRWMIVTDHELKAQIAELYAAMVRPYLDEARDVPEGRLKRIHDSTRFLIDTSTRFRSWSFHCAWAAPPTVMTGWPAPRPTGGRSFLASGASRSPPAHGALGRAGRHSIYPTRKR